ncbi:MAG: serine hydrolase domain-containing protein [Bacteroidia bacterium]
MTNKFILTLATGLISYFSFAQDFDRTKLDSYFVALDKNNKFMGSVAVSQNGKLIYTKTIGYADFGNKVKANENSKYRIGSISKTFTAVLVFKAVEKGKINLDETIDTFFPGIKNANKITIRHLLYHRSGIPNFTDQKDYLSWNSIAKSEKEMLEIIERSGSDFEPDSKAQYSNSNYVLLSYILEKSFKKPYADLLIEHICKPVALTNTYLGGKISTKRNECNSYGFTGTWELQTETDISIPLGAGGIVSTPSDLVRFTDALFSGKLIRTEDLEQMKTMNENFGIGLFRYPFYNSVGYGHTGGIDGFSSLFSHFRDGNISYALVSNGSNFNNNDISIAVLSAVFNKPYEVPEFKMYELKSEDLDKYLGVYSSSLLPLKITISKDNTTLIAQATGQSAFLLEAIEKDKFKFDPAGVLVEFKPAENMLILFQGGRRIAFTKE